MGKSKSKSRSRSKGKKKGKKDNLTDEEKQKLVEQRALAEKEKLIARQNLTKAFLKVKKDKEYELVKLNNNKILDLWRPHLRKQKIKELLDEFKYMRSAFEKAFDKKSQVIQDLQSNLGRNEADYEAATDSHLYQLDKLMEFYNQRLGEVQKFYDEAKGKLYADIEFERRRIHKAHMERMDDLRHGIKELENGVVRTDREARVEQFAKLIEIRTQGNHELYLYRAQMTQKMNGVWEDLHLKIVGYVNTNAEKKKELIDLLAKDDEMSKTIDDLYQRRTILVEGIEHLTKKRDLFMQAYDLYIMNMKEIRDSRREAYNKSKGTQTKSKKGTEKAIMNLALTVHGVNEELSSLVEKRKRLVVLVSRILEEESGSERLDPFLRRWGLGGKEEKVWEKYVVKEAAVQANKTKGFNKFNLSVPNVVHRFDCDCPECSCESEDEDDGMAGPIDSMVKTYAKLERFWIRYNKVAIEGEAILKERKVVRKDNENLKVCVRHYMGSMNPPALDSSNFSPQMIEENTKEIQEFIGKMTETKMRANCRQRGIKVIK